MAEKVKFQPQSFDINSINGGNRYGLEGIQPEAVNAPIEAAAYAQALATNQPNIENAGLVGTPSVSIEEVDGLPRFKFQNLKGEKGIDGKDHSEEIAQLNEKLETYFISAKEQIDINSEEISKNSAKIHNLTGALLEGGVMGVVKVSQAFTTRQTADGENIIDNQNIFPKKIAGSTQNCYSLVDFSSAKTTGGLTVTANNNTLTISGTPTAAYRVIFSADISDLLKDGKTYTLYQSVPYSSALASGAVYMRVNLNASDGTTNSYVYSANSSGKVSFVCDKTTSPQYIVYIMTGSALDTINSTISFMLYEGTDEKPYQPYFKGLKNAYFEKVVSTGKNLVDVTYDFPDVSGTIKFPCAIAAGTYTLQMLCDEYDGIIQNVIDAKLKDASGKAIMTINNGSYANAVNTSATFTITEYDASRVKYISAYSNIAHTTALIGKEIKVMLNHGTEALPYEPYTESELGFSSSPDLAVVEEVAHVNDSSEIAEEAAQYNNSVIYLSDMSNVHVGMLVDFYIDGTIISGATARQIMFLDTEAKFIVVDGADPMEYLPVDATVRRSAQVKLPEWDYILPQAQKIVRQTGRVEFTGTERFILTHISDSDGSDSIFAYKTGVTSINANKNEIISNKYVTVTDDKTRFFMDNGYIVQGESSSELEYIYIRDDRFSTVDEWKAYLAEQYAAGDPVIVEYKLAEATEEDIVIPNNYTAYQGGLEKVVQGNTDNSEYGAMCTLTNDYFVKVGGATNEQTE